MEKHVLQKNIKLIFPLKNALLFIAYCLIFKHIHILYKSEEVVKYIECRGNLKSVVHDVANFYGLWCRKDNEKFGQN